VTIIIAVKVQAATFSIWSKFTSALKRFFLGVFELKKRISAMALLLLTAALLALFTTYAYGKLFSHDRYWLGTIARVQQSQAALIRALLDEFSVDGHLPTDKGRLSKMFAPMDRKLVVDVSRNGQEIYSNFNERFSRGQVIEVVQLPAGMRVVLGGYSPPNWNDTFVRWLQNPGRWFEASFDYVTVPFLWFQAIYALAFVAVGFAVKSSYLERDVLTMLRKVEQEYPST
jgi:hypothetical protein